MVISIGLQSFINRAKDIICIVHEVVMLHTSENVYRVQRSQHKKHNIKHHHSKKKDKKTSIRSYTIEFLAFHHNIIIIISYDKKRKRNNQLDNPSPHKIIKTSKQTTCSSSSFFSLSSSKRLKVFGCPIAQRKNMLTNLNAYVATQLTGTRKNAWIGWQNYHLTLLCLEL